MMTRDGGRNREQIEIISLDELVPEEHLVRKLDIGFSRRRSA